VLLALAIAPEVIRFFQFKKVVGAVVVEDVISALYDLLAVLVKL